MSPTSTFVESRIAVLGLGYVGCVTAACLANLGHRVIGVARTHAEARSLTAKKQPGLILADIQLADGSSGLDAVNELFPQAPQLAPGLQLFALVAADGTPIMVTDSREAAVANAWQNELETVSVH